MLLKNSFRRGQPKRKIQELEENNQIEDNQKRVCIMFGQEQKQELEGNNQIEDNQKRICIMFGQEQKQEENVAQQKHREGLLNLYKAKTILEFLSRTSRSYDDIDRKNLEACDLIIARSELAISADTPPLTELESLKRAEAIYTHFKGKQTEAGACRQRMGELCSRLYKEGHGEHYLSQAISSGGIQVSGSPVP
jgi:hypothetical protein